MPPLLYVFIIIASVRAEKKRNTIYNLQFRNLSNSKERELLSDREIWAFLGVTPAGGGTEEMQGATCPWG